MSIDISLTIEEIVEEKHISYIEAILEYTNEIDGEIDTGNGTWSTNSNKLTMIEDGETMVMDYSITGDVVTVSMSDTSDGDTVTIEIKYKKQ